MNMILKRQLELKKKNGKKGFTLIEVIVVIVILAILAAIAVPALTGYIAKAEQRAVEAESRNYQVALQAIGTDVIAHGGSGATLAALTAAAGTLELTTAPLDKYAKVGSETTVGGAIAGLTGGADPGASVTNIKWAATGALTSFTYNNGKYTAAWTAAGGYVVTKNA